LTCTACTNGQTGISANANEVTIDLNGFESLGVAGSAKSVSGLNLTYNLAPHNGKLRG